MIFSGNTTALGASTIPMVEGYDCSYGTALALVEGARNDLAVFKAMVQADYREMSICSESTGYVQEGELASLHEAVGGGIFKKIAELFKKLVAKIKSIFHNFVAKFRALYMKDKELVKKYEKELSRKSGIDKLEVKWRKYNGTKSIDIDLNGLENNCGFNDTECHKGWKEDSGERLAFYFNKLGYNVESVSEFTEEFMDDCLDSEETVTIGEIGGWRELTSTLSEYESVTRNMQRSIDKINTALEKLVKSYDKKANTEVKNASSVHSNNDSTDIDKDAADAVVKYANHEYDMAQAYQTVITTVLQCIMQINTTLYKYYKAAFMKAVTANPKKLKESATYLDAVAEAAADEVDRVIGSALNDEEISKLSSASTNVIDGDVSNDPDKLTYGPDRYTDNASFSNSNGSINSSIGGGKVEEAYFGKLFY